MSTDNCPQSDLVPRDLSVSQSNWWPLQRWILWGQKAVLALMSMHSYVDFFALSLYYFPSAVVICFTSSIMACGFCTRLLWSWGYERAMPWAWRWRLEGWWRRRALVTRALLKLGVAALLPLYAFWTSARWLSSWRRAVLRWVAVCFAPNIGSLEDVDVLWLATKAVARWVVDVVTRGWGWASRRWAAFRKGAQRPRRAGAEAATGQ
jgi:hypothetical protein